MFDYRRSLRLPLAAVAAVVLSLTTACGNVTGPEAAPVKSPSAPSHYYGKPFGPVRAEPSDSLKDGKTTTSGYNVWA